MVDERVVRAQQKYEEVHEELLKAGIKLLSTKPISSLSLNSLAEYTKVSKTSIYNHFNSSPEHFYYDLLVYLRNYVLNEFNKNEPDDPKEKVVYFYEIYIKLMKENKILCLNLYSQYFIVNYKARFKLFQNKVLSKLLLEVGIKDMETAKTLSLEFAVLLNRFFVYDLTSREFSEYEKEFFTRLKKTIKY
ncbi:MAG: TetR/AcrR family transcriptional regulator [Candidatus Actinomarina sp.]|nr:TetR/AcrR family transcriptional regulator [Candidatus Actinomarina sp.]MDG1740140.1 TetR/AcrR family transcriptional regulator [Candidatus Actinomarina sp.]MDG2083077.1 TetR/AcrR family transcriptional regulator [Candidatus Actinomarina sp.]